MAMGSDVKIRAFLALPLARAFQSEIHPLIEKLKGEYPAIRWVEPSQIHLTLHFFGSLPPEDVTKISKSIEPIVQKTKPLSVFLKGIGGFPNLHQPRVIWVGVEGEINALKTLQASLEEGLRKTGFPSEERLFKAHLTLGRVKKEKRVTGFQPIDFGPTEPKRVNEITLFQSHLTPQGAHYEAIETFPLSSP